MNHEENLCSTIINNVLLIKRKRTIMDRIITEMRVEKIGKVCRVFVIV